MSVPVVIAISAATLALALPVVGASSALDASARAAGAADAGALAAADAALGWVVAEPCALAREVTDAARVRLDACNVDVLTGEARVSVSVSTLFGTIEARARAGPGA